jgi:hypothetical protein
MARKVFFSFHYERDVWRSSIIRNSDRVKQEADERGFIDAAQWEEIKKGGDLAVKRWINSQLDGTTVTTVLIGAETSTRPWVRYEIQKSYERGNALLGIYIHNIKNTKQEKDVIGSIDFGVIGKNVAGKEVRFNDVAPIYDWVSNNGYENFPTWVETVAIAAGK